MNKYTIQIKNAEILPIGIESLIDFYRTMSIDQFKIDDIVAFVTGTDSPFLNVVIDTGVDKKNFSDIIHSASAFFNQHNVPACWIRTSGDKPDELQHGDFDFIEEAPAMYFDLTHSLPDILTTITIQEVSSKKDFEKWIEPIREQFPSADQGESFRALNASLFENKKLRHFIAYYQNQIAASATLFLGENGVMLHNLATKAAFQKRGFGRALSLHMMLQAKQLGFKHCFLDSSEDGFNLYRKLGFRVYGVSSYFIKK